MTMVWVTVTDENGNDFHALMDNNKEDEAWIFTNKESGFHDDVGRVNFKQNLRKLDNGKFGA